MTRCGYYGYRSSRRWGYKVRHPSRDSAAARLATYSRYDPTSSRWALTLPLSTPPISQRPCAAIAGLLQAPPCEANKENSGFIRLRGPTTSAGSRRERWGIVGRHVGHAVAGYVNVGVGVVDVVRCGRKTQTTWATILRWVMVAYVKFFGWGLINIRRDKERDVRQYCLIGVCLELSHSPSMDMNVPSELPTSLIRTLKVYSNKHY